MPLGTTGIPDTNICLTPCFCYTVVSILVSVLLCVNIVYQCHMETLENRGSLERKKLPFLLFEASLSETFFFLVGWSDFPFTLSMIVSIV